MAKETDKAKAEKPKSPSSEVRVKLIKLGENVFIPDTEEANAALNFLINNINNMMPTVPTEKPPSLERMLPKA